MWAFVPERSKSIPDFHRGMQPQQSCSRGCGIHQQQPKQVKTYRSATLEMADTRPAISTEHPRSIPGGQSQGGHLGMRGRSLPCAGAHGRLVVFGNFLSTERVWTCRALRSSVTGKSGARSAKLRLRCRTVATSVNQNFSRKDQFFARETTRASPNVTPSRHIRSSFCRDLD